MKHGASNAIEVSVRFFSSMRETFGTSEMKIPLPENSSIKDLLVAVSKKFRGAIDLLSRYEEGTLIFAVNHEYSEIDRILKDGDKAVLMPPVAGG